MKFDDPNWQKIYDKYEKLMFSIAHRMYGPSEEIDFMDFNSMLLEGFVRTVNLFLSDKGKVIEELATDEYFDKYLKTVLWRIKAKHNVNNYARNKFHSRGDGFGVKNPIEDNRVDKLVLEVVDKSYSNSVFERDFLDGNKLDDNCKKAIKIILDDPACIMEDGTLSIRALSSKLNKSDRQTLDIISKIRSYIKFGVVN